MSEWQRIHLCNGLLERNGDVLLVANRYPNHTHDLWNLPGGRQDGRETCAETVVREFREETSLAVEVGALAYVAESFDPATMTQFTAFCFRVRAANEAEPVVPTNDLYVRGYAWVARDALAERLTVRVVREPLLRYLADPTQQYVGYHDAGITIAFADDPPPRASTPLDASGTTPRRRDGRE
jgi:8-oxo-dGTP diphosphatase